MAVSASHEFQFQVMRKRLFCVWHRFTSTREAALRLNQAQSTALAPHGSGAAALSGHGRAALSPPPSLLVFTGRLNYKLIRNSPTFQSSSSNANSATYLTHRTANSAHARSLVRSPSRVSTRLAPGGFPLDVLEIERMVHSKWQRRAAGIPRFGRRIPLHRISAVTASLLPTWAVPGLREPENQVQTLHASRTPTRKAYSRGFRTSDFTSQ
jgi:hypothetical protein